MLRGSVSVVLFSLAIFLFSCVTGWNLSTSYDTRTVSVYSLNLFNQRTNPKQGSESWNGDWIFRRERLALVDAEIKGSKPDILIFQEMMSRIGSPSETDRSILEAGAATGYEFDEVSQKEYSDTYEQESHGFATSSPLAFDEKITANDTDRLWQFGEDGTISASVIISEQQPITIFNVEFPTKQAATFYTQMQEKMQEFIKAKKLCPKRLLVAGYIPQDADQDTFEQFTSALGLRDVAEDACRFSINCATAATNNDIFNAIAKDPTSSRVDRIFVTQETFVISSKKVFQISAPVSGYSKRFGISKVWPAARFGWSTIVRLPRC